MSWYPLGRPVGTTIYPGMQFTSVFIHYVLNNVFGKAISLNDVCCLVPAWFGVLATLFLGALTAECSRSANAGVAAAFIMAIIPAHIMRSVGGGYVERNALLQLTLLLLRPCASAATATLLLLLLRLLRPSRHYHYHYHYYYFYYY